MNDMQELINIAGMTADAIKNGKFVWVVRCPDCVWFDHYNVECEKGHNPKPPYTSFFCADGKRKKGR